MQYYRLEKTLGVGSFSKVKLATHIRTSRKVAIKVLNRKKLKKMDMGEKVRTEIQILQTFRHPHIIRLYQVIETPTDIYSVMEYVPNGELFDYIVSQGRLDEAEARHLFQQIVSAVEYCHQRMVVHRDLKPENLLLDADNNIKVADFGLSSTMKDGRFLKTSCGSPNYAAPEVISGNLYGGPEVDVWSCGVILYAILCGSLPFDDENIRSLFRKIRGGIYKIPHHVSKQARNLISAMLVVDPLKRIKVPEIRAHPWFQTNLPKYLTISAVTMIEQTQEFDEVILTAVQRLGFARHHLLAALRQGVDLLTSHNESDLSEEREMAVTYNLLLDRKLKSEAKQDDISKKEVVEAKMISSRDQQLQDFLKDSQRFSMTLRDLNGPDKGRWYIGTWMNGDPSRVMSAVYMALKQLDFEWKGLPQFVLKARFPSRLQYKDPNRAGRPVSHEDVVKLRIRLYRTSTPQNKEIYVLDISKSYGRTALFLTLCAHLVSRVRRWERQWEKESTAAASTVAVPAAKT